MDERYVRIGDILRDTDGGIRFRVIAFAGASAVLCLMDTTKFDLTEVPITLVNTMLSKNKFVKEDNEFKEFCADELPPDIRKRYEKKLAVMREVEDAYGPDFMLLCGKRPKPALKGILEKHGMRPNEFWRTCTRYFQSGRMEYSLVDGRHFAEGNREPYHYTKKTGRPPVLVPASGVVRDEETLRILDEMAREYINGRNETYKSIYTLMVERFYKHVIKVGGEERVYYDDFAHKPTPAQLVRRIQTQTTKKQRRIAKTSAREFNNNERPLFGDTVTDAHGPGDLMHADACDDDVVLVAQLDPDQSVGRPTEYMMVDVYSRAIVGMWADFQVNSIQGLVNLFANLSDDKMEYCSRYGITLESSDMWPSGFIPNRMRVDRGAEMRSRDIENLCVKTGVTRELVPGASGSEKGIVEEIFHEMHAFFKVHLEKKGLVEKGYWSNHNREAILTLEQYTEMVIAFVTFHNQEYMPGYPLSNKMRADGVKPIPLDLWRYGCREYAEPMPILDPVQYLYNLLKPAKAKITRRGLLYDGLYYIADNDPGFLEDVHRAGNKRVSIDIRVDTRSVGAVYYIRGSRIIKARLNEDIKSQRGLSKLTFKAWDDLRKRIAAENKLGEFYNQELAAFYYGVIESVIEDARKGTYTNDKNIRAARAIERERTAASCTIADRIDKAAGISEDAYAALTDDAPGSGRISEKTDSVTADGYGAEDEEDYSDYAAAFREAADETENDTRRNYL